MRYKTILLCGPPGSGKGTQGKILGSIPGFYHCACGDVFRGLDLQSEVGRRFWEYSSRGELVPDEFTVELWTQTIRGAEMINRFHPETELLLLDGIPRNVRQAEALQDTLDVQLVLHLTCPDPNKIVERLRRRALRENRLDDADAAVIRRRLEVYESQTRPLLACFPPQKIAHVDATLSQIRVLTTILSHLLPLRERDSVSESSAVSVATTTLW